MADDIKPWTIKGIPPEARNAAIAAADREKMNIGEWIERAILTAIKSDRQLQLVELPVKHQSDIGEIERLVAMSAQLASAAGEPPPKAVTRMAYGLLKDRLASIKSESPTKRGHSPTKLIDGQTSD